MSKLLGDDVKKLRRKSGLITIDKHYEGRAFIAIYQGEEIIMVARTNKQLKLIFDALFSVGQIDFTRCKNVVVGSPAAKMEKA